MPIVIKCACALMILVISGGCASTRLARLEKQYIKGEITSKEYLEKAEDLERSAAKWSEFAEALARSMASASESLAHSASQPPQYPLGSPLETTSVYHNQLEGCAVVAADGKFLGRISRNDLSSDSIFNDLGPYGSKLSQTSIWNELGQYGGELSQHSPFNPLSTKPPRIISDQTGFVAFLSVNRLNRPAISPYRLVAMFR